jgi:hypothetical protein
MDTTPLEWPEEHIGENRTDPAVATLNVTPDLERELIEAQN